MGESGAMPFILVVAEPPWSKIEVADTWTVTKGYSRARGMKIRTYRLSFN